MAKKTQKTVSRIISYILLLLMIAGIIAFFATFTNNFTDTFKSFYLEYNDEKIISDKFDFSLSVQRQHRFDVKYPLGFLEENTDKIGYTVKVIPNTDEKTDFTFTVNGIRHTYSKQRDLTHGFDISVSKDFFTITANKTLSEILSEAYLNEAVIGVPEAIQSGKSYFQLLVTTTDNTTQLRISFQLTGAIIRLSPDEIVF